MGQSQFGPSIDNAGGQHVHGGANKAGDNGSTLGPQLMEDNSAQGLCIGNGNGTRKSHRTRGASKQCRGIVNRNSMIRTEEKFFYSAPGVRKGACGFGIMDQKGF